MPRLLLVGSSHAVRVRSALEREMYARSPDSQVLVLGKGGLRADESVTYIERHEQQIVWYEPSHVVVHVGHCDLLPINVQEMGKPLTKVIWDLEKIRDKLSDIVPNAKFAISEMFPRVIAHKPTTRDLDTKVRAYNRKIAQASKLNYNLVAPVVYHPRFRLSHRAADPQYFLANEGRFYGVHLSATGNRCFAEDLVDYVI